MTRTWQNMYSELAAVNNVTNSEVFIKFWPKSRLVPLKTCLNTKDCTMQQMTYISEEYIARVLIGLFIVTQNVYQILVSILRFLMKITQGKLFKLEKYFTKLIEKHGPKKPPYLDTFHAVQIKLYFFAWKSLKTRMQDKISWISGLIKFLTSYKQIF